MALYPSKRMECQHGKNTSLYHHQVVTYGFDAFQTYIGPGTTPAGKLQALPPTRSHNTNDPSHRPQQELPTPPQPKVPRRLPVRRRRRDLPRLGAPRRRRNRNLHHDLLLLAGRRQDANDAHVSRRRRRPHQRPSLHQAR